MFGKKRENRSSNSDIAMRIYADGKVRDVSFRELLLSVNMSMEALMSALIKKGIITPEDLLREIEDLKTKHQSGLEPDPDSR